MSATILPRPVSSESQPGKWFESKMPVLTELDFDDLPQDWSRHLTHRENPLGILDGSQSSPPKVATTVTTSKPTEDATNTTTSDPPEVVTNPTFSDLPEVVTTPTASHSQGVTTAPTASEPSIYSESISVPGTNMKLYPDAPISIDSQERFPVLVELFKRAVDNNSILKLRTGDINYELRICGTCPEDALPSVVVFCRKDIFRPLRKLLEGDSIKYHYVRRDPGRLPTFLERSHRETNIRQTSTPSFRLVFWRDKSTPTKRRAAEEPVEAQILSPLTMCGSTLRISQRASTLALNIQIGFLLYGLTVDHVRPKSDSKPTLQETVVGLKAERNTYGPGSAKESRITDSKAEETVESFERNSQLWIDDVEYDELEPDEDPNDQSDSSNGVGIEDDHSFSTERNLPKGPHSWQHLGNFVHIAKGHDKNRAYLDWALIDVSKPHLCKPNLLHRPDDLKASRLITTIAKGRADVHTPVIMVSAVSGIRKGTLLPGVGYIGGEPGQNLCEALIVDFPDGKGLIAGDCGSVVVQEHTMEVYGHVVASNPLNHAYIIPISSTFQQISEDFGTNQIILPDPIFSLAELANDPHTESEDKSEAQQLLKANMALPEVDVLPAFCEAAGRGSIQVLTTLLQALDDVDLQRLQRVAAPKKTPLEAAVEHYQRQAATLLLEWGFQPTNLAVQLAAERDGLEEILVESLAKLERRPQEIDALTLTCIGDCAKRLEVEGRYLDAEKLLRFTSTKWEELFGPEHSSTSEAFGKLSNLARVLAKHGKYKEAERVYRHLLKLNQRTLDKSHPNTLTGLRNLAEVLQRQGKYEESERLYHEVLSLIIKVFGNEHTETVKSLRDLAHVLQLQGKYVESESVYREYFP